MWLDWADGNNYLLLIRMRTVWVAHMEFPLAAVTMGPSEVGMTNFHRWPCAGAI